MQEKTMLVVRDVATRARLAGYLKSAGLEIQPVERRPPESSTTSTVVWVIEEDEQDEAAGLIRSWLSSSAHRYAIIVTRTPSMVRAALQVYESRLEILVPPVFPWQLVDAIRAWARGPR